MHHEMFFRNEGKTECEINIWICAASAVIQNPHGNTVVKKELRENVKLSIYFPTVTYGSDRKKEITDVFG